VIRIGYSAKCGHNWSHLAITGYIISLWIISGLFRAHLALWSQYDQTSPKVKKLFKRGNTVTNMASNLSYLETKTNIGPLYATSKHILPVLSQNAILAKTWYARPRFLDYALKWTNSFKLEFFDHSWPSLPTTGHTGIRCHIMHYLPLAGVMRHM